MKAHEANECSEQGGEKKNLHQQFAAIITFFSRYE